MKKTTFMSTIMGACALQASAAVILATYDFDTNTGVPTSFDPLISASSMQAFSVGGQSGFDGGLNSYDDPGEAYVNTGNANTHWRFTVSGASMDLERLSFTMQSERGAAGRHQELSVSVENLGVETDVPFDVFYPGTTLVADDVLALTWGNTPATLQTPENQTVSVEADLTGIATGNAFEIRIYGGRVGSSSHWSLDNVVLEAADGGVVALPEPNTVSLLLIGALTLARARKRCR